MEGFTARQRLNTPQREGRRRSGVDAKLHGAGSLITGFGDQITDSFVPRSEWIAEMPDWNSKKILELLADRNLLLG